MTCCTPTIFPFYNIANSTIDYSAVLRNKYGRVPQVEVLYWDEDAQEYTLSNNPGVSLSGNPVNSIEVNHGGLQTGIIRVI